MSPETINRCITEILEAYPGSRQAREGNSIFVRLARVYLPEGCLPACTEALVILEPSRPKPRLLVRDKPTTPTGRQPRNVSPEMAGGETWHAFSYNVAWQENKHTAVQFIESALRRFARNE